jgi:acyl CoA:acetate/3-ketoacid CoA transferase alpha subunit
LIDALRRTGAKDLTVVNNNAGNGTTGLAALLATGQVRKIICSFPRQVDSFVFEELYRDGRIELEVTSPNASGPPAPGSAPSTPRRAGASPSPR